MGNSYDIFLRDSSIFIGAQHAETATRILAEAEYATVADEEGNITSFYFDASGMGDHEELYQSLAPFMRGGSFLELCNEMGDLWRWVFDDGKCIRTSPVVLWPKPGAPRDIPQQTQKAFAQHLMAI